MDDFSKFEDETHRLNVYFSIFILLFVLDLFSFVLDNQNDSVPLKFNNINWTTFESFLNPEPITIIQAKFPPIRPKTTRVFVTACHGEKNIPSFRGLPVTLARCEVMNSAHCFEAPYLLDFLYNWYDNLTEETIVFSHAHLKSWHIDNIEDAIFSTQNTPYWKTHSFGGFANGLWKRCCDNIAFQDIYPYLFNGTTMPRVWDRFSTYPCCSTFFVKTNQIRMRPKENYRRIFLNLQKWVEMNPNLGWHCSRVFEYTWHILLGQKTQIDPPKGYKWLINKWAGPCPYSRTDII